MSKERMHTPIQDINWRRRGGARGGLLGGTVVFGLFGGGCGTFSKDICHLWHVVARYWLANIWEFRIIGRDNM